MSTVFPSPTLTMQMPTSATYGSWLDENPGRLLDIAKAAEDAGFDRVAAVDHVVMGPDTSQYTWAKMTVPQDSPWLEPLTVLTAIAAATSSIRLSTRILIAPLRPATLLAKTIASLDVISGGRVDLGVGTGWQREEHEAQGLDFDRRGQLLNDTIAACRRLWTGEPVSFESETVNFHDVCSSPKPVQERLPVWFGGNLHRRNEERILELGDGWIPIMQADADTVAEGAKRLTAGREAAGVTSPLAIQGEPPVVRRDDGAADIAATLAHTPTFLDAGANDVFVSIASMSPDPEGCFSAITEIAERFQQYR